MKPLWQCVYNISEKISFFLTEAGDNETIEPVNEEKSVKKCEGEEAKEEITLRKALEMGDKLKMY